MRSKLYPWLDGATTRVPKLFPVKGMRKVELDTPTPDDWQAESRRIAQEATG